MMRITEAFIDQVIYHRVSTLVLKGSVYTSTHVQELIEFKKQTVGENIILMIERAADDELTKRYYQDRADKLGRAREKLELLAAMDGRDSELSEEALEVFYNEVVGTVLDG